VRVLVIANSTAGALAAREEKSVGEWFADAFRAVGVDAEVMVFKGKSLALQIAGLPVGGIDTVVVAGGDGTVSAVANLLAGTNIPLAVFPAGTLNHFAKDVGAPFELEELVDTVVRGSVRAVDVGEVNGRVFVNNASIGLYPRMVKRRDHQRLRFGRGKWPAMFLAAVSVFRRYPMVKLRLVFGANRESVERTAPFVFVGNNEYQTSLLSLRGRPALDTGRLGVYIGNRTGRFGMLRLALRALLGRLSQTADFELISVPEFVVDSGKRRLHIALDGELLRMRPPLYFRTRPAALRVVAAYEPEEHER
jgi:diacylglycerol kinase family enzyme